MNHVQFKYSILLLFLLYFEIMYVEESVDQLSTLLQVDEAITLEELNAGQDINPFREWIINLIEQTKQLLSLVKTELIDEMADL